MFYKTGVLENLVKFTVKHLCWSPFFNKVAGLRPATLLKKRLQHKCCSANFAKFFKTSFLQNTSRWLLLIGNPVTGYFTFHKFALNILFWFAVLYCLCQKRIQNSVKHGWKLFTIFTKSFILDVSQGSGNACVCGIAINGKTDRIAVWLIYTWVICERMSK